VRSLRCAIPYIQPSARSYTPMHTYMPTYQMQTRVHALHVYLPSFSAQRNSIYHAQACPTTTHSYEQAMYCTHLSVWSVELWASAAAMCCAPSAPIELFPRLYAHVCERRTIQRTCIAHDARSRARNTSVRRSAEAHQGIALDYARFGALLIAVLPYACAAIDRVVSISCTKGDASLPFMS
jgi:hypothetical protein